MNLARSLGSVGGLTLVRDFAAAQSSPVFAGEGDHAQHGGGATSAEAEAEAGMAEMSEKFRKKGGEIYLVAK